MAVKKGKLTPKQELFCKEYLKDFNGARAARDAGYSVKTSTKIASENLSKPDIMTRIKELARETAGDPLDEVKKIILELQMIAFGDLKDFVKWNKDGIKAWTPSDQLDAKSRIVQEIQETTTETGGSRKLKLYDKMRALEMLGKYHKIFTDKVEHSNPDGSLRPIVNINIPGNKREKGES